MNSAGRNRGSLRLCPTHVNHCMDKLASYLLAAPVPSTRVNIFLQFALVRFRDDTDIHQTKNSQNNQNSSKKTLLIEVDQDSGCSPKPSKSKKPKQRLRKSANLGPERQVSPIHELIYNRPRPRNKIALRS